MLRALLVVGALGVAAIGSVAPPAHADSGFIVCPSGLSGIASTVTSCPFADNVRRGYFAHGSSSIAAYSPVTGQVYDMSCVPGFIAHFDDGETKTAVNCFGGIDAAVVVW